MNTLPCDVLGIVASLLPTPKDFLSFSLVNKKTCIATQNPYVLLEAKGRFSKRVYGYSKSFKTVLPNGTKHGEDNEYYASGQLWNKCFWKDGKKEGEGDAVAQKWSTHKQVFLEGWEKRRARKCGGVKMVNSGVSVFGRMGKRRVRRCGGAKMVNLRASVFGRMGNRRVRRYGGTKMVNLRTSVFGRMGKRRVRRCGGAKMVNLRASVFGRMGKRRARRCGGTKMVNTEKVFLEGWEKGG
jgi:hypothetical protein